MAALWRSRRFRVAAVTSAGSLSPPGPSTKYNTSRGRSCPDSRATRTTWGPHHSTMSAAIPLLQQMLLIQSDEQKCIRSVRDVIQAYSCSVCESEATCVRVCVSTCMLLLPTAVALFQRRLIPSPSPSSSSSASRLSTRALKLFSVNICSCTPSSTKINAHKNPSASPPAHSFWAAAKGWRRRSHLCEPRWSVDGERCLALGSGMLQTDRHTHTQSEKKRVRQT